MSKTRQKQITTKKEKQLTKTKKSVAKTLIADFHNLNLKYEGASKQINKKASATPIRIEEFGTKEDNHVLTQRETDCLNALIKKYKDKVFSKTNLDTGVINGLGRKGFIEFVGGDVTSSLCQFKLTGKAK